MVNKGRVIESRSGITANGTLQVGSSYHPGVCFVEVVLGSKRGTVKLIKQYE